MISKLWQVQAELIDITYGFFSKIISRDFYFKEKNENNIRLCNILTGFCLERSVIENSNTCGFTSLKIYVNFNEIDHLKLLTKRII